MVFAVERDVICSRERIASTILGLFGDVDSDVDSDIDSELDAMCR